jgi:hypothetical protein
MKLVMCKKICDECPFSKESLRGWLGPHSIEEILHMQQSEYPFSCHKTRDDQTTNEAIQNGEYPICRGYIASASKSCKRFGQHPIVGQAMLKLQEEITQEDKDQVLARWEFPDHHNP